MRGCQSKRGARMLFRFIQASEVLFTIGEHGQRVRVARLVLQGDGELAGSLFVSIHHQEIDPQELMRLRQTRGGGDGFAQVRLRDIGRLQLRGTAAELQPNLGTGISGRTHLTQRTHGSLSIAGLLESHRKIESGEWHIDILRDGPLQRRYSLSWPPIGEERVPEKVLRARVRRREPRCLAQMFDRSIQ